jgi:hypothetical protein
MYITWRKLSNRYYAYLVSSYWDKEKKAPRTTAVYLGSSLPTAQKNLEKHLFNLTPNQLSSRAKIELLAKLGEKAPPRSLTCPPATGPKNPSSGICTNCGTTMPPDPTLPLSSTGRSNACLNQ